MKSLFGVALALLLFGCSHTYSVGLEEGEELSEAVAVRASREALEKSGLDISQLEPAPYGNSMSVFARIGSIRTTDMCSGVATGRRRDTPTP